MRKEINNNKKNKLFNIVFAFAILFALLIISTTTIEAKKRKKVYDGDIVNTINNHPRASWKAHKYPQFENKTVDEVRNMFGTIIFINNNDNESNNTENENRALSATIPTTFDSRSKWSQCIHPIRNQQSCGSCWAFSSSEVLSDRFCIASNGRTNVILSPQYQVSCDTKNLGCNGGYLPYTWSFLTNTGIPTDSCVPYTSGNNNVPSCPSKCSNGSAMTMYKSKNARNIRGVSSIQNEIITNGPVQSAYNVYRDFMSYKSGVYKHVSGEFMGGHAIKIIGWGVDSSNNNYWIVANSWGTSWGMNGYFYISRGTNECGIESNVYAADAAI